MRVNDDGIESEPVDIVIFATNYVAYNEQRNYPLSEKVQFEAARLDNPALVFITLVQAIIFLAIVVSPFL